MLEAPAITWDNLYQELFAFVNAKVKDRVTAEDIVQDIFVKVHTKANQLKDADRVSAWIYQITRNTVADHFRSKAKHLEPVNLNWDSHYHELNDCVSHCLKVLIKTLPDTYRIPLELAEFENLSQQEIAERLSISYSGARSRVQRARRMLKTKIDELYFIKTDGYGNVVICEDRTPCCCPPQC